jgi:predicted DNA-binding transcriptional regulator YafY
MSNDSEPQTHEADPYSLVYIMGAWHLTAYCHLRQDIRNFRLERMEDLHLLSRTFERPVSVSIRGEMREAVIRCKVASDTAWHPLMVISL